MCKVNESKALQTLAEFPKISCESIDEVFEMWYSQLSEEEKIRLINENLPTFIEGLTNRIASILFNSFQQGVEKYFTNL